MHHPLIFWLLVAATLCVDAVAIFWTAVSGFDVVSATLFLGLAYGQLSALCMWAIISHHTIGFRWTLPFVVGLAAGLFAADADRPGGTSKWDHTIGFIGLFWVHVAVTISAIWSLRPIRLLRGGDASTTKPRWRFSTKHLMGVMTVSAVLLALLARNQLLINDWGSLISLVIGNVALLAAMIVIFQMAAHRLRRIAGAFAVALAIGAAWEWAGFGFGESLDLIAFYLIQAFTLWAWFEVLPLNTVLRSNAADASNSSRPPKKIAK